MKNPLWTLLPCLLAAGTAIAQPVSEASYDYTTQRRDTVIRVSQRLLSDPRTWREVARFNQLKNPNRIPIGFTLRIPMRLLRSEAGAAMIEHVAGGARAGSGATAAPLRAGESVPEGTTLQTGPDGLVIMRLVDGSVLRLAGRSQLQIDRARRFPSVDQISSGVKLESGRVEVQAAKAVAGKPGFEVRTPQGVLGVRGTEFRVSVSSERQVTTGEVLEGAVQFAGRDGETGARLLAAGFGTLIDTQQRVAEPSPLLPAPNLEAMPVLQERLVLRFPLQALAGAVSYRGQLARDAQMREILADDVTQGAELRFTDLDDGNYVLRVRAIDARGLEGRDASLPFRLKARPEPPLPAAPAPRAVTRGTEVELSWATNPQAQSYHLQVASDESFATLARDLLAITSTSQLLDKLAPGEYFWRLASVRAGNDRGPWGAARTFVMRPLPKAPEPPAISDTALKFQWEGEPGQTFEFQLARDAQFTQLVLERKLDKPEIELPRPAGGVYFMRMRARDADGFQGPFTSPQHFTLIDCMKSGDGNCLRSGSNLLLQLP